MASSSALVYRTAEKWAASFFNDFGIQLRNVCVCIARYFLVDISANTNDYVSMSFMNVLAISQTSYLLANLADSRPYTREPLEHAAFPVSSPLPHDSPLPLRQFYILYFHEINDERSVRVVRTSTVHCVQQTHLQDLP